jgi:hypothetical protein
VWLLLACKKEEIPEGGFLVSNTGTGEVEVIGIEEPKVVLSLAELEPGHCDPEENSNNQCLLFEVEEAVNADGIYRYLMSWSYQDGSRPGSPGLITSAVWTEDGFEIDYQVSKLDFSVNYPAFEAICETDESARCGLNMVHSAVWTPDHSLLAAGDTLNSRVLLLEEPEKGTSVVHDILDDDHPDWEGFRFPNGVKVWEEDGRILLLSTFKGGEEENQGRIVLWDITDEPTKLWAYPESGFLAAVHNGLVGEVEGQRYLFYAHSFGNSAAEVDGSLGSVGIARFEGVLPPVYLGELVSEELGFVREVEPVEGGLLVTDSACENEGADCGREPKVVRVAMPELEESGKSGAFSRDHGQQVFVEVEVLEVLGGEGLLYPYETDSR